MQQSLADKATVESELRRRLDARDAELARNAEFAKRRDTEMRALQAEFDAKEKECEEKIVRLRDLERAAAASSRDSVGAVSSSSASRLEHESRVSALQMELDECREELAKQAKSHSKRLQEVQEGCQHKLRELRKVHNDAMEQQRAEHGIVVAGFERRLAQDAEAAQRALDAARAETTRAEVNAMDTRISKLREELSLARNAHERLKIDKECLQEDLSQAREEVRRMEDEVQTVTANWKEDTKRMEDMAEEIGKLKQELMQHMSRASSRAASRMSMSRGGDGGAAPTTSAPGPAVLDESIMKLMEEQVLKLGERLRLRELEVMSLKKTVQEQCTERGDLMRQVAIYKATIDDFARQNQQQQQQQQSQGQGQNQGKAASQRTAESLHDSWVHLRGSGAKQGFAQGRSRTYNNANARRQIW